MLFNSQLYLFLFLPLTVAGCHLLARLGSFQLARIWLLLASLFFYSYWNIAYLPLLLSSIVVNYGIGRLLSKWRHGRRALLVAGIMANLGLLVYFKYSDFLLEILSQLGVSQHSMLNLVLPLAISFYTFQQIAYLVDCYRSEAESYDLASYSLFVTFFPQLVAGPIVHHREMMPQFQHQTLVDIGGRQVTTGLVILLVGLFKNVAGGLFHGLAVCSRHAVSRAGVTRGGIWERGVYRAAPVCRRPFTNRGLRFPRAENAQYPGTDAL